MNEGKQASESVLERRLRILWSLPDASDDGISAEQLVERFSNRGFPCTTRSIQRDFVEMSAPNSIWQELGVMLECRQQAQKHLWRHGPGSTMKFLHRLSPEQALTLSLVEQTLSPFLPHSTARDLLPELQGAQRTLSLPGNDSYARYRERVRVVAEGPPRATPAPVLAVLRQISEALLKSDQINLRYAPGSGQGEQEYRLHPVGLVQQGLFHWLLAVKDEHIRHPRIMEQVRSYRCDRISAITPRRSETVAKELPTLDEALAAGRLEFFSQEAPITLVLRFAATQQGDLLCASFRDAPLGNGQVITPSVDGGQELRTQVRQSLQLDWLLQRYADRIKVVAPAPLAQRLRDFALAAAAWQAS